MDAATIGHRAFAANLSDVAAMGARPVLATIAVGVTPATTEAWLLECYRGMDAVAAAYGARIVGGDISRAPALLLSITIVGEVARGRLRRRNGGHAGDILAVTGPLGASRAGLELMRRGLAAETIAQKRARAAYERPVPRIAEGRWLGASANVHALMDCSDGLALDVDRLARASRCGATLFDIPIDAAAKEVASAVDADPLEYALEGGEDFELIAALAPRAFAHLARRFELRFARALLPVGRLDAAPGLRMRDGAETRALVPGGWDHFEGRA